ncbi:AAA family ATPase [Patescibacteria group bacterium]|nr:AAA family ATPase [Patescibacteria group bacterium]
MYLERLDIQGFKSFATKTTLKFNKGISAVVGPNGSGKSNIADAVRWVLGEQSLKLLRGKKSQDVIFSGSGKKSRLGMAEVSMYINNKDGKAPIDYSELIITRRVYQNGEGEYFINNSRSRLQDILMLLAKANFGQKSYSVIGQGMIETVLTSTPQERKDFFDEAAGVKQYQIKRDQANNKLIRTDENLQQTEMLLQEIAPRLRSLTRQVKKLERRGEVEKELVIIQQTHYSILWGELEQQYDVQKGKYDQLYSEQEKLENERTDIQKAVNQIAQEDTRGQLFQQYQTEYQSYQAEKNRLLQEEAVLKGKSALKHIEVGRSDLAWLEKKKEELSQNKGILLQKLLVLEERLKKEKDLLENQALQQQNVVDEFTKLEKELEEGFSQLQNKPELNLPHFQDIIGKIYARQKELWKQLETIESIDELPRMKDDAGYIMNQLEKLQSQICSVQTEKRTEDLSDLQKKISTLLKTRDNLVNEIHQRRIQFQEAESETKHVKKEIDSVEAELNKILAELKVAQTASNDPDSARRLIKEEEVTLKKKLHDVDQKIESIQIKLDSFNKEEQVKKDELVKKQQEMQEKQNELNNVINQVNVNNVETARIETKKEDLENEIQENLGIKEAQAVTSLKIDLDSEYKDVSYSERVENIRRLKHQLELIGGIDPTVNEEYQSTSERNEFLTTQIKDLKEASVSLEKVIEELDEKIKKQFKDAFEKINHEFTKYFKSLFDGGKASLQLHKEEIAPPKEEDANGESEDDDEVLPKAVKRDKVVTGIDIVACPPGKKLSDLNMLSGGEKAMASIALICAIIANNPPPFCVLDEVDAALDEANSMRYAQILNDLSHKTQFVAITHNRATMHHAVLMYGVTMGDDGVSKLLSVRMEDVDEEGNIT